jgi:hypothetical protein
MPVQYEPQPPPRNVSNLRLFWIIWCCLWAGFWFISGFFTIIGFLGAPVALLFILLPIGKGPRPKAYYVPPSPPPLGQSPGPYRVEGPAHDEAYQAWLKDQGPRAS